MTVDLQGVWSSCPSSQSIPTPANAHVFLDLPEAGITIPLADLHRDVA